MARSIENSRTRLLAATIDLVRAQGYAATRVEDVCAAADQWDDRPSTLFAQAPYHSAGGAVDRLLGYIAYRRELLAGELWEWSCYAGTTIQEVHETHPRIRDACALSDVITDVRTLLFVCCVSCQSAKEA